MSPTDNLDKQISELRDWRGTMLARLRKLINEASPELTEGWKWETAVWTQKRNVVAIGVFKEHVKINFFKGVKLADPEGLVNSGLDDKESRSIDVREGDTVNEQGLKELVRRAAAEDLR